MSKVSPENLLSLCPYPLLVHTFCPPKKLLLARCFPLSIHLTVVHTFLPKKKTTILEGFTPSTIPLTGAHILDKITTTFQV